MNLIEEDSYKNGFVVLTGSAGGIGNAILTKLCEKKINVIATYNSENEHFIKSISENLSDLPCKVIPIQLDITSKISRKNLINYILSENIQPLGLINAAGFASGSLFQMTSEDALRKNFEVNFFGTYFLTQQISKIMSRYGSGTIIIVSTVTVNYPSTGMSAYGSSKAALSYLTKSLAIELAPMGIRVNEIVPGLTDTQMMHLMDKKVLEKMKQKTALGRVARPSEIADVAYFLMSSESSFVTGAKIEVDGGFN